MSKHDMTSRESQRPGGSRYWTIVLVLWCLLAAACVSAVWLLAAPTYTATAQVEVDPIVRAVLYEEDKPMPLFDSYLNTQTQVMASQQVLTAALADPVVGGLPVLKMDDPIDQLRRSLSVKALPKTNLIEVGVTQKDTESAIRLTKATLTAYMARAHDENQAQEWSTRLTLEKLRESLRSTLDKQSNDIRQLAEAYGTSSDKMFEILREGLAKYTFETKQELERADLAIYELQEQIKQLENGSPPTTQPQDLYDQRQQAIDSDGGVRTIRQELEKGQGELALLRVRLGKDHEDVKAAQQKVEHLRAQLAEERRRAAADVDKEFAQHHREWLEAAKARLNDTLAMAQRHRQVLKARVDQRDAAGMSIGRQGLEIQNLREQRDLTRKDYERVVERLKRMEIESQRPTRISLASAPEIRPDGIADKRIMLTVLAIVGALACALLGALAFGCVNALVRCRPDPHVPDVRQAKDAADPRIPGALDCASLLDTCGVLEYRLGLLDCSHPHAEQSREFLEACLRHPYASEATKATATFHLARTLVHLDKKESYRLLENLLKDPKREQMLSTADQAEAASLLQQLAPGTQVSGNAG